MAATTLDVYDDFLKEWYLQEWIDQLTSMTTTWKLLRRRLVNFAGKSMVVPIRTGRNFGVGSIPTSGSITSGTMSTMYPAGSQGIGRTLIDGKIITGSLQVAQDTIDKSKNDKGAFFEAIDFEMRGLVDDMADYADNIMHLGGDSSLAIVPAAPAIVAGPPGTFPVSTHHPFFEGMRIEAWSGATTGTDTSDFTGGTSDDTGFDGISTGENRVITNVVRNADGSGVLTVTGTTAGLSIGDVISRAGVRNGDVSHELMGLRGAIDSSNPPLDSDFQNIDRATNSFWQSHEDSIVVLPTESAIQTALDHTHDISRGDVDVLMCHRLLRRLIYDGLNSGPTRFSDTNVITSGYLSGKKEDYHPDGADYLFFDGRIPIIVDRFSHIDIDAALPNTSFANLYGLDLSSLYIGLITDFTWWAPEGRILHRSDNRAFGVMADLYLYGNLVCDAPAKNFKLNFPFGVA